VFTARYGLITYIKQIMLRFYKFNSSAPYTLLSGAIAPIVPLPSPPTQNYATVPTYLTHETIIVGRSSQMYYNI